MQNGIHFISGLPRSGSTLLAAILRQNPRFHAAMMGPVGFMYMALERAMSRREEAAGMIEEAERRNVLKGLFTNYYHMIQKDKLVFDTNRVWCAKLPALTQLFPKARIVCCVRDVPWIVDSIERLVRKNAFELSGMFGFEPASTVYARIHQVAAGNGLVGYALDALKEGFYGEQASRLILVEYEALARAPKSTLQHLYTLLDEPPFSHDFENVEYQADDFDLAVGMPGLHTVRRKVEWVERQSVLPPELFQRFENDMFWRAPDANIREVPIIRYEA
jgi:sulfotransferase